MGHTAVSNAFPARLPIETRRDCDTQQQQRKLLKSIEWHLSYAVPVNVIQVYDKCWKQ